MPDIITSGNTQVDLISGNPSTNNSITYVQSSDVTQTTSKDDNKSLYDLTPEEFATLVGTDTYTYTSTSDPDNSKDTVLLYDDPNWGTYIADGDAASTTTIAKTLSTNPIPIQNISSPDWTPYNFINISKQLTVYKDSDLDNGKIKKNKIIIHHTLGWGDPTSTASDFDKGVGKNGKPTRICPSWIIGGKHSANPNEVLNTDGLIIRVYDDDSYWTLHSDLSKKGQKHSIAISLCNLGGLTQINDTDYQNSLGGNFVGATGDTVYQLDTPYKSYSFFHNITDSQLTSLKSLIIWLASKYQIQLQKFDSMTDSEINKWFISNSDASDETMSGIFIHAQINNAMHDIPPQPEFITMLKNIDKYESQLPKSIPQTNPDSTDNARNLDNSTTQYSNIYLVNLKQMFNGKKVKITSIYGWRNLRGYTPKPGSTDANHPQGVNNFHTGVDIVNDGGETSGMPIYAPFDCKIWAVHKGCVAGDLNCGGGAGNFIFATGTKYAFKMDHCLENYVNVGDSIKKGQLIGKVGTTGYSGGAHLHFELSKAGKTDSPNDPLVLSDPSSYRIDFNQTNSTTIAQYKQQNVFYLASRDNKGTWTGTDTSNIV